MSNYCLGVVAHVERQEGIAYLSRLAKPDVIIPDDGSAGVTANHLAVITNLYQTARHTGQEWIVVLEDDALLCDDFHGQLSDVLYCAPSPIVSLYNGTGYPAQYQRQFKEITDAHEACFILHRHLRHAVAYAIHRNAFELGLIEMMAAKSRMGWPPDDAISAWCRRYARDVAYTNPSIVDHRDEKTVIKQRRGLFGPAFARNRPRHAHWFSTRPSYAWDGNRIDKV